MSFDDFKEKMLNACSKIGLTLKEEQVDKFYKYMMLLIEWNEKINLTRIIEPDDIIIKHFIDSIIVFNELKNEKSIIDVGTGAGFPGIPLKILYPEIKVTLLDSLNKRIIFLEDVIEKLNLKDIEAIHGRAEDFGKNKEYREKYDIAISRAVAETRILVEYLTPFVKVNKKVICMKGSNVEDELEFSKKAFSILGLKIEKVQKLELPMINDKRNIIVLKKCEITKKQYPRKAGMAKKNPL